MWKGEPTGFANAAKGPPKGKSQKSRNITHHQEVGKIGTVKGKGKGKISHKGIIWKKNSR